MRTMTIKTIDAKIEDTEEKMVRAKQRYKAYVKELEDLEDQKKLLQSKEVEKALSKTKRSYEEIMAFLMGMENEEENPY